MTLATCAGFSLALSIFLHFAFRDGGDSGGSFEPSLQLSTLQLSAILVYWNKPRNNIFWIPTLCNFHSRIFGLLAGCTRILMTKSIWRYKGDKVRKYRLGIKYGISAFVVKSCVRRIFRCLRALPFLYILCSVVPRVRTFSKDIRRSSSCAHVAAALWLQASRLGCREISKMSFLMTLSVANLLGAVHFWEFIDKPSFVWVTHPRTSACILRIYIYIPKRSEQN